MNEITRELLRTLKEIQGHAEGNNPDHFATIVRIRDLVYNAIAKAEGTPPDAQEK